jgi:hypothetical protein
MSKRRKTNEPAQVSRLFLASACPSSLPERGSRPSGICEASAAEMDKTNDFSEWIIAAFSESQVCIYCIDYLGIARRLFRAAFERFDNLVKLSVESGQLRGLYVWKEKERKKEDDVLTGRIRHVS